MAFAKMGGYICALTLDPGFNSLRTDLYRLRRIAIEERADNTELAVRVSGVWDLLKNLIKREKGGKEFRLW